MINSILDNDLYKFTMQQAVHALYPRAQASYTFINRASTPFPQGFAKALNQEILRMKTLRLRSDELTYLEDVCYFFTPVYLEFLSHYQFNPEDVHFVENNGNLSLTIEGPWFHTILWEVPLMAIISELYFKMTAPPISALETQHKTNIEKASRLRDAGVPFADFGTRRRFSAENHGSVLRDILRVKDNTLIGTSNVQHAKELELKPIGTHAHEWFMYHGAVNGYRQANKIASDAWTHVYQGSLGIALTDTYTTNVFLSSFDAVKARLFDGVRHDSGNPYAFADQIIKHYQKLHISPQSKTIVFSDGLCTEDAIKLNDYCKGKINASFGIGTHLTNDVGAVPLNMVIKLSKCREDKQLEWIPTVKLSDVQGKHTGSSDEIDLCLKSIQRSL